MKQLLTDGTSAIYSPPGWLLFTRNGAVLAQPFDPVQLEMMVVKINGDRFETPRALFNTHMLMGTMLAGIEYDVTADGQRFLIGTVVGEPAPVNVILNWTAGLQH